MTAERLRLPTPPPNQSLSQQQLHSRYVLQLLLETWKLLRMLPNINRISTCHSKEITICGETAGATSSDFQNKVQENIFSFFSKVALKLKNWKKRFFCAKVEKIFLNIDRKYF